MDTRREHVKVTGVSVWTSPRTGEYYLVPEAEEDRPLGQVWWGWLMDDFETVQDAAEAMLGETMEIHYAPDGSYRVGFLDAWSVEFDAPEAAEQDDEPGYQLLGGVGTHQKTPLPDECRIR